MDVPPQLPTKGNISETSSLLPGQDKEALQKMASTLSLIPTDKGGKEENGSGAVL